jgi:superfamily II DNA helicase RecQ
VARPTGKLHGELFGDGLISRDGFEDVLGALARSGLVRLSSATFEKDGQSIPYRKVVLTPAGEAIEEGETLEFQMKVAVESVARKRKGKGKAKKAAKAKASRPEKAAKAPTKPAGSAGPSDLEQALRTWRLVEAKRRGVPAFRILTDATLQAIAEARPSTASELLAVPGIGLKSVQDYGAAIFRLVAQSG